MFSSRTPMFRSVLALFVLVGSTLAAAPAQAHEASEFQVIQAPFTCGTEWVAPFGAHHSHQWNLDFNRTDLDYGKNRQHDLGQPLFAQADGTVVRIAVHHNAGTYVEIDYGDYTMVYVHMVHDSVPAEIQVGTRLTAGQFFGQIGDTGNASGFAHLHLESFDSRGFADATSWELKQAGQPQTEVTFNGVPVEYSVPIVSNNCVGDAGGGPDPADGTIGLLTDSTTRRDHIVERLQAATEALDGTTDAAAYLDETANGTNLVARIPGTDLSAEAILISTSYTSAHDCLGSTAPDMIECPGATEHAASTSLVLDLADALTAAETPPRRTVVFAFWDEYDDRGGAAQDWYTDPANTTDDGVVAVVDYGIQGANAALALRGTTTASRMNHSWPALDARFAGHDTPALAAFSGWQYHSPASGQLADLGRPTIAFGDVPGPCIGTGGDTATVVDADKLAAQTAEAIAFVGALAAGDPIGAAAPGDDLADGSELLAFVERTGYTAAAYDALRAVLDVGGPVGTTVADAAARLLADLAAEPCAGHGPSAPFTDVANASYARVDVGMIYDLGITTGTGATAYSPDDDVTRLQMAAFLARLWRLFEPDAAATVPMPFTDVDPSSYAFDDVRLLVELEVTNGTGDGTYAPAEPVTRLQMAAFLGRLWRALHPDHDPDTVPPHPFTDVDPDSYAAADIALIASLGITNGTSATTYSPGDVVTREQMAAFIARFIRAVGAP